MARRINTYQVIKKVHLYASIVLLMFLMMYVLSGFVLINHNIFPHGKESRTEKVLPFSMPKDISVDDANSYIKKFYHIKGRTTDVWQRKDSSWQFNVSRPGIRHEVLLNNTLDTITIKQFENKSFGRVISRIHLMRHYENGWKYYIWAFMYDLSAIAMMLFSITGVYMWWRLRKKYFYGYYFLAVGIIVPVVVIVWLMV